MNIKPLLSSLIFISIAVASESALAECKTVMGGCVPAEGMVDLPSHMKSQIANRVVRPKTTIAASPAKASINTNNKKTDNATLALANNTK